MTQARQADAWLVQLCCYRFRHGHRRCKRSMLPIARGHIALPRPASAFVAASKASLLSSS